MTIVSSARCVLRGKSRDSYGRRAIEAVDCSVLIREVEVEEAKCKMVSENVRI